MHSTETYERRFYKLSNQKKLSKKQNILSKYYPVTDVDPALENITKE